MPLPPAEAEATPLQPPVVAEFAGTLHVWDTIPVESRTIANQIPDVDFAVTS